MAIQIDVAELTQVDPIQLRAVEGMPDDVWLSYKQGIVIQIWKQKTPRCDGTPWAGTLRVAIKRSAGKTYEDFCSRAHSVQIGRAHV